MVVTELVLETIVNGVAIKRVDHPRPLEPGGTAYSGPVEVTTHELGGQTIRLVRPADPDRLLDDPGVIAWNRRDDYMPYWAYVWPGAYLLAEAVIREPWPVWKEPGLRRWRLDADWAWPACLLWLLDCESSSATMTMRPGIRRVAVAANGFDPWRCILSQLDWRDPPDERFPIILGSDVIYEARLVPLVANLLSKLLAPGGLGLIATPYRLSAEGFPAALASVGLTCRAERATANHEDGGTVEGTVYRISWTRGAWATVS